MQPSPKNQTKELLAYILLAGLLAGTLDALAAIIDYYFVTGKNPVIIFIYIASGIFGKQAYSYGQQVAWLGLLFHYLFAIIFAAFYFLIYPKLKFLQWNKLASAIIYGIFVWIIMNRIIVPLSKTPPLPFHLKGALIAVLILIVCIGIPISFMASSFYKRKNLFN